MVFPYYSRPEDETQEPEEEQQPEETQSWLPSYIYAYVNPKPPPPPPPLDPAIEEYNQRQEARIGYQPDKKVTVAQPAGSSGGAEPTAAPRRPSYLDDVDAYTQRAEQRAAAQLEVLQDISQHGQFQPDTLPEPEEPIWQESTPLTLGQAQHVEHLLNVETNVLAREVLFTLQRDGMPPRSQWNDFMAPYALMGWDATSDAIAWGTLAAIAESDWDETSALSDWEPVETTAQDLGDDWIEGLVIIHAKTGDTLLDVRGVVTADGSQYVGVQDTEMEALKGLPLIFVHNHRDTDASSADLVSAFDAGAKLLIVITRHGREYVYIRGRDRMVKVREGKASYEVGPGTLDEFVYLLAQSQARGRTFEDDLPEHVFLQEEQYVELRVDGNLKLYESEEAVFRGDDESSAVWPLSFDSFGIRVLDQHPSRPYAVKIEFIGKEYWIDIRDPGAELKFRRADLGSTPFVSRHARVSEQEFYNTSLDFLNALTAIAFPPAPRSFVVDDDAYFGGKLDIELSDLEFANRSKLGLLSRDLNILDSRASFQIQSPVVGHDVRVEIVSTEDKYDRDLGNYVLISFPASVFLQNPQIMENLANDPNHDPSEWREGGRIYIGFAHLSSIDHENIYPEAVLEELDQATIGWTGNTAFNQNFVNHLDVSMAYFGPTEFNKDGFAEAIERMGKRWDYNSPVRGEPNSYMSLVESSNLYQGEGRGSVYGENIDVVLVWPQFDRLRNARTTKDAEGNNESIYQKD